MNNVKHLFSQVKKTSKKNGKTPRNKAHPLDLLAKYINSPAQEMKRTLAAATKAQEKFKRDREKLETEKRIELIHNLPSETKKSLAFIIMGRKSLPVLNFSQGNMAKLIGVSIRTISSMLLKDVDINLITGRYERIANRYNLGSFWDSKEAFFVIKYLCDCLPEFFNGSIFSKLPTTYTKIIAKIVYKMRDYIKNKVCWINFDEIYRSGVPTKGDFQKSEENEENNYGFSISSAGVVRHDSAYAPMSCEERKSMREELKEWAKDC